MRDEQIGEMIRNLIEVYLDRDFLAGFMATLGNPIDDSIDLENMREAATKWLDERVTNYAAMVDLGLIDKPKAATTNRAPISDLKTRTKTKKKKSAKRQRRGGRGSSNSG
jgi:hypothetical protein